MSLKWVSSSTCTQRGTNNGTGYLLAYSSAHARTNSLKNHSEKQMKEKILTKFSQNYPFVDLYTKKNCSSNTEQLLPANTSMILNFQPFLKSPSLMQQRTASVQLVISTQPHCQHLRRLWEAFIYVAQVTCTSVWEWLMPNDSTGSHFSLLQVMCCCFVLTLWRSLLSVSVFTASGNLSVINWTDGLCFQAGGWQLEVVPTVVKLSNNNTGTGDETKTKHF